MCSSRKYPYPPSTQGTFILDPHSLRMSIPGAACHTPVPPGISVIFHLGWGPPGKNISAKKLLHHTTMRNVIVAEIKGEKIGNFAP